MSSRRSANAGTRLFYCPLIDVLMATPCCGTHGAHHDGTEPAVEVTQTDCCRPLALPALPPTTTTTAGDAIAPPLPLALAATTTRVALAAPPHEPSVRALAHGLPPPLSSSARCSLLRSYRL